VKERDVTFGEEAALVARFVNYTSGQRNVNRSPRIRRNSTLSFL